MDGCFEPGRIIVLPKTPSFSPDQILERVDEVLGEHREFQTKGMLPILLSVEPGTEQQSCADLLRRGEILAASPNFYLQPASPVRFEEAALSALLGEVGITAPTPRPAGAKGRPVSPIKVAVLDSGWSAPKGETGPAAIQQYYADRPPTTGATADATAHGTAVIEIIRRLAPNADIRSFRIYDRVGTLWALLGGLLLAEAIFSPHVINLSLALKCETKSCAFCKRAGVSQEQLSLLLWAFRNQRQGPAPAIIAAGGNNEKRCAVPAAIDNVIAVGAFDWRSRAASSYAKFDSVPAGRFVMAPGGSPNAADAFAFARTGMTGRTDAPLYGTSFAAPCITGLAARYLEDSVCPSCSTIHAPGDYGKLVLDYLAASGDRSFPEYDVRRHGLGVIRYRCNLRHADVEGAVARILNGQNAKLRELVAGEAQSAYDEAGSPTGQADSHWWLARSRVGLPPTVDV